MSKNMYKMHILKPYIIQCMIMPLTEKERLDYLLKQGFKISARYLYKLQKQIKESRFDRLSLIAKTGFVDQHLERIDQLELINREMWSLYRNEPNNFKKSQILMQIAELQTYISPYYSASKRIMEMSIQDKDKEQQQQQPVNEPIKKRKQKVINNNNDQEV